jgi:eukaryotic-like serine/threonine-protein kinase
MGPPMRAPDTYIGREIANGKYQILQKIGSGGMGSVYKALQPNIGRMVAIKILHPKLVNRKDLVSRFSREAKALAHLSHPNTVKVIDDGELEDGSLYIVMEFLEGRNLNQTVRSGGPMAVDRAMPILVQVCGALEEAHTRGIVHRDLKPENIFLCNMGGVKDFPKVLDFGLAKVTEQEMRPGSIILTQEGMVFGTPEFMSPEQAQGKTLDAKSDLYSLAVIIYEVLTGKLPFDAKTPMEFIQHHVMTRPIPLDERVVGLTFPQGLGDVIAKALNKDPSQRYASAAELADALKPYAQPGGFAGSGPVSIPSGPSSSLAPTPMPPASLSSQLTTPSPPPAVSFVQRMGLGLVVAVAAGALIIGAGIAVAAMQFLK